MIGSNFIFPLKFLFGEMYWGGGTFLISFESTQLFYFVFTYFPGFHLECEAIKSVLFFLILISISFISHIILYLFPAKAFKVPIDEATSFVI